MSSKFHLSKAIQHQTIQRATKDGYKFLHGAAIVHHKGVLYANWANSPTDENGPHETLQGRRSQDGGKNLVGFGSDRPQGSTVQIATAMECCLLMKANSGASVLGLASELQDDNSLDSKQKLSYLMRKTIAGSREGIVMQNCWPYDQPVRMSNGNWITGGQDKDGLPVVAISHGEDFSHWDSILIPYPPRMKT